MLHVIEKLSLILVTVRTLVFSPLAVTVFHPLVEATDVRGSILPLVLPEAPRLSRLISPGINVPVREDVRALPMLQTVSPLAFISVTVFPVVDAISLYLTLFPLADVGIAHETFPDAEAVF